MTYIIPHISTGMKTSFKELKIKPFLHQANITKAKGVPAMAVFLTIFLLTFQGATWFQQTHQKQEGKKAPSLFKKDVVYRFLNKPTFNWRRFLLILSRQKCLSPKPQATANLIKKIVAE